MARRRRRTKDAFEIEKAVFYLSVFVGLIVYAQTKSFTQALTMIFISLLLVFAFFVYRAVRARERISRSRIEEIDVMDGIKFEKYLDVLFSKLGYKTSVTKASGDFGADVILEKDGRRIVVQAKRYSSNVNLNAVQEVTAARSHYGAQEAWVVTNQYYKSSAIQLARSNDVKLINRDDLIDLILQVNPEMQEAHHRVNSGRACRNCGQPMNLIQGTERSFYRCNEFPKCRYIEDEIEESQQAKASVTKNRVASGVISDYQKKYTSPIKKSIRRHMPKVVLVAGILLIALVASIVGNLSNQVQRSNGEAQSTLPSTVGQGSDQKSVNEMELVVTLSLKNYPDKRFLNKALMEKLSIDEGQVIEITGPNGGSISVPVFSEPETSTVIDINKEHIRLLYQDRQELGVNVPEGYSNNTAVANASVTQKVTIRF